MRVLGMYVLALQVQGAAGSDPAAGQDVFELVARSSPISKLVLLVLILFSVTSWGIILLKLWALNRAERQSTAFLDVFRRSAKFSEVQAVCKNLSESPLVGIFQAGYAELNTQLRQGVPTQTGATVAARVSESFRFILVDNLLDPSVEGNGVLGHRTGNARP